MDEETELGDVGVLIGNAQAADFSLQLGSSLASFASVRELVALAAANDGGEPVDAKTAAREAFAQVPVPDQFRDAVV